MTKDVPRDTMQKSSEDVLKEDKKNVSIYETLRDGILNLRFKPGEVISIKALCEVLKAGRSPVRDALIRLEKEGLIVTMPQKGTMISKIDRKRAAQEQFLRESLEEKVLEVILEKEERSKDENDREKGSSRSDLEDSKLGYEGLTNQLEAVFEKQREAVEAKNARKFLELDMEFHHLFFKEAGQELAFELITSMCGHYQRIRLLSLLEEDIMEDTFSQHKEMIGFLKGGKKEKLRSLLHEHLTKVKQEESVLERRYPDLFVMEKRVEQAGNPLDLDFLMESNRKGE